MFLLLPNDFLSQLQGNSIIVSFFIIKNGVVSSDFYNVSINLPWSAKKFFCGVTLIHMVMF